MSDASVYIAEMLDAVAVRFPEATIYYAYSPLAEMHIVDLRGNTIEALDAETWAAFYDGWVQEFEGRFIRESLLFVREGALVRVEAAEADQIIEPKPKPKPKPKPNYRLAKRAVATGFTYYEWDNDSLENAVAQDFVYGALAHKSRGGGEHIIVFGEMTGEAPPSNALRIHLTQSVPVVIGTDSFYGARYAVCP